MSRAEFTESFESWMKGDPEYEIHIMGPAAKGDNTNLVSFQCIGEHAGGEYSWDTNEKAWTGSQLLFSKAQIDAVVKQFAATYQIRDTGSAAGPLVDHTVRLYLLDRDGDVVRLFDPSTDVAEIAKAMREQLK
jgi:glutathione peroxidase-family protein